MYWLRGRVVPATGDANTKVAIARRMRDHQPRYTHHHHHHSFRGSVHRAVPSSCVRTDITLHACGRGIRSIFMGVHKSPVQLAVQLTAATAARERPPATARIRCAPEHSYRRTGEMQGTSPLHYIYH